MDWQLLLDRLKAYDVQLFTLTRTQLDLGTRQAVGSIVRYAVLVIGFALVLQNMGRHRRGRGLRSCCARRPASIRRC